jgi:hypothetical protein
MGVLSIPGNAMILAILATNRHSKLQSFAGGDTAFDYLDSVKI